MSHANSIVLNVETSHGAKESVLITWTYLNHETGKMKYCCFNKGCQKDKIIRESYINMCKAHTRCAKALGESIKNFYPTNKLDGVGLGIFLNLVNIWNIFEDSETINLAKIWGDTQDIIFGFPFDKADEKKTKQINQKVIHFKRRSEDNETYLNENAQKLFDELLEQTDKENIYWLKHSKKVLFG